MLPISNKLSLSGTVIIHIVLVPFFLGDYAWFVCVVLDQDSGPLILQS